MSTKFSIDTIILPENSDSFRFQVVFPSESISFRSSITAPIQLASPRSESGTYAGLLYYPIVSPNACTEDALDQEIQQNVTIKQLPANYNLIAMAPASKCREYYVSQAVSDGAKAMVFYNLANETGTSLSGAAVGPASAIPVYLLQFATAAPILQAMQGYSVGLRDVPFGQNLSRMYDAKDWVRLTLSIDRNSGSRQSFPGLWVFLLIVLAILCTLVAATSAIMHIHQYMARRDLRRRIIAGEIDLEALGIKRLTVPKNLINGMPNKLWRSPHFTEGMPNSTNDREKQHFDQTACSICLDDYQANETMVRVLPCFHVFHPDCIDPFLEKRSSLCPLCKQSVLPKGYVPSNGQLSTATVMRERQERRQRQREASRSNDVEMQFRSRFRALSRVADLSAAAPTAEDEAAAYRQIPWYRRYAGALFPILKPASSTRVAPDANTGVPAATGPAAVVPPAIPSAAHVSHT